jgi:hypothetical protein
LALLFALLAILGIRVSFHCHNPVSRTIVIEDLNEVKAHALGHLSEFSHLQGTHAAHEISLGV